MRVQRRFDRYLLGLSLVAILRPARADEMLYRFDGTVHPRDDGWLVGECLPPVCTESFEEGHFVLRFDGATLSAQYYRLIAFSSDPPLPSLWVEWRFYSSWPSHLDPGFDGEFQVNYSTNSISDLIYMTHDFVVHRTLAFLRRFENPGEFHTYRFESKNAIEYTFSVDGDVFFRDARGNGSGVQASIRFNGEGGDGTNRPVFNRWDHVWYGTLSDGEAIVSSDPPQGVVDANLYPNFDRFTVTFDAANYMMIDEISVSVTGGPIPAVTKTRRPDNGPPEVVEVVLDRPLPLGFTTSFIFDTGGQPQVVEYTYLTLGSCCPPDGSCLESDEGGCAALGGTFHSAASCMASQACCFTDGSCEHLDPLCCVDLGGRSLGPDTVCEGDRDSDGADGQCGDDCPDDPQKTTPGACGCGNPDTDSDLDTIADCVDQCPGVDDRPDQDGDGIPDCVDFIPIPTTTTWGLVVLALLLLCALKIACLRSSASRVPS